MTYQNIFLSLGSNLGGRLENLNKCAQLIELHIGAIIKRSSIYETAAWGNTDQPDFLNQALQVESELQPHELLTLCLSIEQKIGRIRDEKWGARIIDIDIIYFNSKIIHDVNLHIPHPRMAERKFVLTPLTEIAPDFVHPTLGKTNTQLLKTCIDPLEVKIFSDDSR